MEITTPDRRLHLAILCGGQSSEHRVSLQSAQSILGALDRDRYDLVVICIDRHGRWYLDDPADFLVCADDPGAIALKRGDRAADEHRDLAVIPGTVGPALARLTGVDSTALEAVESIDVVFPVLHGPRGEDGTVQGLLTLAGLPYVGAGVASSAVCMDKDIMKRLLRDAGIPTAGWMTVRRPPGLASLPADWIAGLFAEVCDRLGMPCFVKPANLGSSVGINQAHTAEEFAAAIDEAFRYDHKVIVEESIAGREIECSVLGAGPDPELGGEIGGARASLPGEIVLRRGFYDYNAKYIDGDSAGLVIPADLPDPVVARVKELALRSFDILDCQGMARADFFVKASGDVLVNELNTIPGFTAISMYPKLWEASGLPYSRLLDRLIALALWRDRCDRQLSQLSGGHSTTTDGVP